MRQVEKENRNQRLPVLLKSSMQDYVNLYDATLSPIITPKLIKEVTGETNLLAVITLILNNYSSKFKRISGLRDVPNLRILNLGCNQIRKIEGLHFLKDLIELDLSENRIVIIENIVILL